MLPPFPPWEGMHPLLVHFPIVLLFLAPLPALLAVVMPGRRVLFTALAFAVMTLAALAAVVTVESGEAAAESAHHRGLETPAIHDTMHEHAELAEATRNTAIVLMLLLGGALIGFRKRKVAGATASGIALVLLAGTLAAAVLVTKAGYEGGQLVHRYGVHAVLGPADAAAPGGAGEHRGGEPGDAD
jgi:uncharacterized membrane protein